MTDRIFTKDFSLMTTITSFKYTDNTDVVADWYYGPLSLRVQNWNNISAVNQALITTDMNTNGYQFDQDI